MKWNFLFDLKVLKCFKSAVLRNEKVRILIESKLELFVKLFLKFIFENTFIFYQIRSFYWKQAVLVIENINIIFVFEANLYIRSHFFLNILKNKSSF